MTQEYRYPENIDLTETVIYKPLSPGGQPKKVDRYQTVDNKGSLYDLKKGCRIGPLADPQEKAPLHPSSWRSDWYNSAVPPTVVHASI